MFLVGLNDGTLPIQHVLGDANSGADDVAVEEERRLLYVGVTRAREHLQLSWALARNEGGRKSRRRSRFLNGLIPEDSPASRVAAPSSGNKKRPRCRVCGKPLIGTSATMLGRCEKCPSMSTWNCSNISRLGVWTNPENSKFRLMSSSATTR
ncbi:hypothetical protein GCM10020255_070520 [Rhodococcus baikonurensis]